MAVFDHLKSALVSITNPAPYHLLFYSTLLGTELYQTFIMTKLSYQVLPITAFRTLQKRVFPAYFRTQSLLLVLVAVTIPPRGPASFVANKWHWWMFGVAGVTAGLNLMVYGPATQEAMISKVHQGTYLPSRTVLQANLPLSQKREKGHRVIGRVQRLSWRQGTSPEITR